MAYQEKCSNCDKLIDFGGRESLKNLPDNAIKFDGEIYCKQCVHELIQFGADDALDDIADLKEKMRKMIYQMGLDIEMNIED